MENYTKRCTSRMPDPKTDREPVRCVLIAGHEDAHHSWIPELREHEEFAWEHDIGVGWPNICREQLHAIIDIHTSVGSVSSGRFKCHLHEGHKDKHRGTADNITLRWREA